MQRAASFTNKGKKFGIDWKKKRMFTVRWVENETGNCFGEGYPVYIPNRSPLEKERET